MRRRRRLLGIAHPACFFHFLPFAIAVVFFVECRAPRHVGGSLLRACPRLPAVSLRLPYSPLRSCPRCFVRLVHPVPHRSSRSLAGSHGNMAQYRSSTERSRASQNANECSAPLAGPVRIIAVHTIGDVRTRGARKPPVDAASRKTHVTPDGNPLSPPATARTACDERVDIKYRRATAAFVPYHPPARNGSR